MRPLYFFDKAFRSIKDSLGISLLTSFTISLTLLVIGCYALTLKNLEEFSRNWGRSSAITAYLTDNTTPADWDSAQRNLQQLQAVKTATLVKPSEALERFKRRSEHAANLAEGVSPDILPAAIEIELHQSSRSLKDLERVALQVGGEPHINDVDYGKEEFKRLNKFILFLRYGGGIAGALLAIATLFIISNTIHLTVYSRRDEISILQLVGATYTFVRTPFIIEGALWGLIGGATTWLSFWAAEVFLTPSIIKWAADTLGEIPIHLYDVRICSVLLVAGLVLGGVGSHLAVNRYLSNEAPA